MYGVQLIRKKSYLKKMKKENILSKNIFIYLRCDIEHTSLITKIIFKIEVKQFDGLSILYFEACVHEI